jgi:regulator of PEP synthase PpsR (kinase-PPPase family)
MRPVYFVSDHTGITAEVLGQSLMARFDGLECTFATRPFVDTPQRAQALVEELTRLAEKGERPIVFATLSDPAVIAELQQAPALFLDFFNSHLGALECELGQPPSSQPGRYHRIANLESYQTRIDAIEFTLMTDDGLGTVHYHQADVILVGVSRAGKTPTSLFLALQYGLRTANYPLTEEDFARPGLPEALREHRAKLFGLTIDPLRLHQLRRERRPGSAYASLERCEADVRRAEQLFARAGVRFLNTTSSSIEEIAAKILQETGVPRRLR